MPKITTIEGTMDECINYVRFVNRPYRHETNSARGGNSKGYHRRSNNQNLKVSTTYSKINTNTH